MYVLSSKVAKAGTAPLYVPRATGVNKAVVVRGGAMPERPSGDGNLGQAFTTMLRRNPANCLDEDKEGVPLKETWQPKVFTKCKNIFVTKILSFR